MLRKLELSISPMGHLGPQKGFLSKARGNASIVDPIRFSFVFDWLNQWGNFLIGQLQRKVRQNQGNLRLLYRLS